MLGSSNRTAFCTRFFSKILSGRHCGQCWRAIDVGAKYVILPASRERLPEAGSSSRSTHGRRMMGLRRSGVPMWTTLFAICAIALQHAESPCLRPGRDILTPVHQDTGGKYSDQTRKRSEQLAVGRIHSNRPIKKLTSLEHRMHNHRQSARNCDCGTFEPQSFPELPPKNAGCYQHCFA